MPTAKICTRCGERKPLDGFYRNRRHSSGYASWCKLCCSTNDRVRKGTRGVHVNGRTVLPHPPIPHDMRWCTGCHKVLPRDHFSRENRKNGDPGTLHSKCRRCRAALGTAWRESAQRVNRTG